MLMKKKMQEERKMARFTQFAMAATEEALEDAAWRPVSDEQREATVLSLRSCSYVSADFFADCMPFI